MAENLVQSETVKAWAEITIRVWEDKVDKLHVYDTYRLINSFQLHTIASANGDISLIQFMFTWYGKFADMGVGKGTQIVDVGKPYSKRKPKKWYSPVFYSQVKRLGELLADKYSHRAAISIVENVDDNALKWDKSHSKV